MKVENKGREGMSKGDKSKENRRKVKVKAMGGPCVETSVMGEGERKRGIATQEEKEWGGYNLRNTPSLIKSLLY